MATERPSSDFRVVKRRTDATITFASGQSIRGFFFIAEGSPRHGGPERVADLLNSEPGFFPFETHDGETIQTVQYNRSQVVMVTLAENEASLEPGYEVATRRAVSALLSTGQRVTAAVRVFSTPGRDRLSDWARQPATFRYFETGYATLIVNVAHLVEVSEIPDP